MIGSGQAVLKLSQDTFQPRLTKHHLPGFGKREMTLPHFRDSSAMNSANLSGAI